MTGESSKLEAQSSKGIPSSKLEWGGCVSARRLTCTGRAARSVLNLRIGTSFELCPWGFELGPFLLLLFAAPLILTGCSRSPDPPSRHLFSHAEIIGTRGTGLGQFTKPRSLALDRDDNLYVADMTGRVQKFSPRGEVLSSWRMPETDLGKPKGMCRDADGNIVIVEPHYQRVNHFAPDGTLVEQWGSRGTNISQLVLPRSVAANSRGDIFVSEYTTVDRVQGFSANGRKPIVMFGKPGTGDGEFNRAEGLDVDTQDRVYVADSCNHRIQIFSRDGKWLKTYSKAGRGLGELSYPYDVRVDRAGRQYVCEFGNSRIQVFGTNNEPLEIIGGPGSKPGQFNNPWAIAIDSHGNLFVADAGNHRVQKLVRVRDRFNVFEEIPPSPPEEAARRASSTDRIIPAAFLTRSDAGNDSDSMETILALPLLGQMAGVRLDQSFLARHAPRITSR